MSSRRILARPQSSLYMPWRVCLWLSRGYSVHECAGKHFLFYRLNLRVYVCIECSYDVRCNLYGCDFFFFCRSRYSYLCHMQHYCASRLETEQARVLGSVHLRSQVISMAALLFAVFRNLTCEVARRLGSYLLRIPCLVFVQWFVFAAKHHMADNSSWT